MIKSWILMIVTKSWGSHMMWKLGKANMDLKLVKSNVKKQVFCRVLIFERYKQVLLSATIIIFANTVNIFCLGNLGVFFSPSLSLSLSLSLRKRTFFWLILVLYDFLFVIHYRIVTYAIHLFLVPFFSPPPPFFFSFFSLGFFPIKHVHLLLVYLVNHTPYIAQILILKSLQK